MKKQLLVTVIALVPAMGFAKVSDFNAMIADNVKEQNQLHSEVKNNVIEARDTARERIVIVENESASYNAPTRKDLLAFKKEKKNYAPSQKQEFERLANEIHLSDE